MSSFFPVFYSSIDYLTLTGKMSSKKFFLVTFKSKKKKNTSVFKNSVSFESIFLFIYYNLLTFCKQLFLSVQMLCFCQLLTFFDEIVTGKH